MITVVNKDKILELYKLNYVYYSKLTAFTDVLNYKGNLISSSHSCFSPQREYVFYESLPPTTPVGVKQTERDSIGTRRII